MRTAETIVKEYLERGYSIETLKLLAESRPEPLCTEMMAVLKTIEFEQADEVACVATQVDGPPMQSDGVFFVAADDAAAVDDDGGVDFDIMAEVSAEIDAPQAGNEDSVAEILVGETEGAEMVAMKPPEEIFGENNETTAGASAHAAEMDADNLSEETQALEAEEMPQALTEETAGEAVAMDESEPVAKFVTNPDDAPVALEHASSLITRVFEDADIPTASENSADYIPGSVVVPMDEDSVAVRDEGGDTLPEPQNALEEIVPQATEAVAEAAMEVPPADEPAALDDESKLPRKERRRRERAERKKQKRVGKKGRAKAQELPEIILARSEGTDTMVPEKQESIEEQPHAELPQEEAEAVDESAASVEAPAEEAAHEVAEEPAVGETLNIVAPADILAEEEASACAAVEPEQESEAAAELSEENAEVAAEEREEISGEAGEESVPVLHFPEMDSEDEEFENELMFVADDSVPVMDWEDAGEHLMIIANGGIDLRADAERLLADEEELAEESAEAANNIILFRNNLPVYDGDDVGELDEEEALDADAPMLRMLPQTVADEEGGDAAQAAIEQPEAQEERLLEMEAAEPAAAMSPLERESLIRAFGGAPSADDFLEDDFVAVSPEHVIVSLSADPAEEAAAAEAEAAAAQAEIEREYQERLDEFAKRLLDVQSTAAESEARAKEKAEELSAKETELSEVNQRLADESGKQAELEQRIEDAKRDLEQKSSEVSKYRGLQEEHERLYNEFEDLRRAYNEVVTDVMPGLQRERDDLVLTIERQSETESTLRTSLRSAKKRTAAGYALGAAACLMLVALPVVNWLKSDDAAKEIAVDHQLVSELRKNLEDAQAYNTEAEQAIVNLEREIELARGELAAAQRRNNDLSRRSRESGAPRSNGVPSRTTENLALQGGTHPNGGLRVNEVRDPVGEISQAVNRSRQLGRDGEDVLASPLRPRPDTPSLRPSSNGRNSSNIPVNAVARMPEQRTAPSARTTVAASTPRRGEVKGTVKAGEGVAQVVYRMLGTRDPEVINWVIRENGIKRDRRGNPIIHPNQELRLPENGRMVQAASASRR